MKYYDVVSEVEPKRLELAGANDKLAAANTTLKQVQDKVALLNAQVQELEDQYNKVGQTSFHCLDCLPFMMRGVLSTWQIQEWAFWS